MENLRDQMYKWQLMAVVTAVERFDAAVFEEVDDVEHDRLYGEMMCELAVARSILDDQSMIGGWVGTA